MNRRVHWGRWAAVAIGWALLAAAPVAACGNTRQAPRGTEHTVDAGQAGTPQAGGSGSEASGAGAPAGAGAPEVSLGGDGGTTATPGEPEETLDSSGQCRRPLSAQLFGCADDYATEIARPSPCGSLCAGLAGGELVTLTACTPSIGCAYDPESQQLIGAYYSGDEATHCGDSSSTVIAGDFPSPLTFNSIDVDEHCVPPAEASVSPLFNAVFGVNDPLEVGKPCRAGHDQSEAASGFWSAPDPTGKSPGTGRVSGATPTLTVPLSTGRRGTTPASPLASAASAPSRSEPAGRTEARALPRPPTTRASRESATTARPPSSAPAMARPTSARTVSAGAHSLEPTLTTRRARRGLNVQAHAEVA